MTLANMNSQLIRTFHQKRRAHGLVYVSNDRMGYSLHLDLLPGQWDDQVDQVTETALLIGPVECDGEIFFRAKMKVSSTQLEALFSLGRPLGPVICWECRQMSPRKAHARELIVSRY